MNSEESQKPYFFASAVLLASAGALILACAGPADRASSTQSGIPVIYCTDLFHPHDDPDDHFDIAVMYSMKELDLKAVILDQGDRQLKKPGYIPVSQLNRISGRSVPFAIGLGEKLKDPSDKGLAQKAMFQKGVNLILKVLGQSPVPVVVVTTGSVRDVAAAFNREPQLFREKVSRLMIFIGEASTDYVEYNSRLDPQAYVCLMRSGLPVYWVPCFDGGLFANNGSASYWQAGHDELLKGCAPEVLQYFIYALDKESAPPLKFVTLAPDPEASARLMELKRNLWCSAVFTSISGRKIVKDSSGYRALPPETETDLEEQEIFDFEPVQVTVTDEAKIIYGESGDSREVMRFRVLDPENYDQAMTSLTNHLLMGLGLAPSGGFHLSRFARRFTRRRQNRFSPAGPRGY